MPKGRALREGQESVSCSFYVQKSRPARCAKSLCVTFRAKSDMLKADKPVVTCGRGGRKIWAWADVLLYPEKTMRSYGFNFGPVLGHIYFHMMDFIFTYSFGIYMICFAAGCVLWLTKTEKKK